MELSDVFDWVYHDLMVLKLYDNEFSKNVPIVPLNDNKKERL